MKYLFPLTLSIILLSCSQQTISYKEINHRTDASKEIVKEFSTKLKTQLQQAMKTGGPLNAIKICHEQAPIIAKELSTKTGWSISRTSLKPRVQKPDAWETRMMNAFEKQHVDGDAFKYLFVQDIVEIDNKPAFRYMQAIETKQVCLLCHGENIAPEVAGKIKQLYPSDTATGFKLGDIRGSFSIVQSLD